MLGIEASIPKSWYKAGDTIPVTLVFTPTGYKKVERFNICFNGRLAGSR